MNMIIINNSSSHSEIPRCPSCEKPEDIKEVCNHCGHEYKQEENKSSIIDFMFNALIVIIVFFILGNVVFWLLNNTINGDDITLVEQFIKSFKTLWILRLW